MEQNRERMEEEVEKRAGIGKGEERIGLKEGDTLQDTTV